MEPDGGRSPLRDQMDRISIISITALLPAIIVSGRSRAAGVNVTNVFLDTCSIQNNSVMTARLQCTDGVSVSMFTVLAEVRESRDYIHLQ